MKLLFRVTLETEIELSEKTLREYECLGLHPLEVAANLNEDTESHQLVPEIDPHNYPIWQHYDSGWEAP